MQQVLLPTKCSYCDILLEGREQFVGHMIHSHELPIAQAEEMWESSVSARMCRSA
ncbi:hypothetical protein NTE_00305 [Candidatus Nitrososphaera evergladensis SR1]|uniref:C2H2-type domain-containing protein n=1 Tax=Candidatus Nitrososphaera evergladensis SR1 TaxID=1459636 RepID=A0A075MNK0_9ARCH|nr:hypothetical protein [Candidatus Nitrososphaera evergladensis]AIF82387.1 hypothetical protein NTE_00305 [Candidatus Nitrososphaera evergladensis SR1]